MKQVRCAIYTRKSSEEGLEQAFNSLDAQREACAAYILSQASEGWTALPDIYDDGGLSGGTLERPALQRLLAELQAGRVDIIVVYKVDRLTRSLLDFSKLVEAFDKAGTSFVSVTQSFNTTTSMGRLTLNMLLSFAQFEREVTAERIRDKIAASKAKGMWMGGTPPLGYEPDGRSLKIVEEHAAIIRDIFERYLQLGNVRLVAETFVRDGVHSPQRARISGTTFGGVPFSRGQIYGILKCATYVGEVHHKDQVYAGRHKPILDRHIWDRTQAMLADNLQGQRTGARASRPSVLAGKVFDASGEPLVTAHACKGKVRYRYYVSRELQQGNAKAGMRIPALELERAVAERIAAVLEDPLYLAAELGIGLHAAELSAIADHGQILAAQVRGRHTTTVNDLINRVCVFDDRLEIVLTPAALAEILRSPVEAEITLTVAVRLTRSGRMLRLVDDKDTAAAASQDVSLVRLIVQARQYWKMLRAEQIDIKRLAAREGVTASYLTRVLRLAYLSPAVVDAVLAGKQTVQCRGSSLFASDAIAPGWVQQAETLLGQGRT